MSALSPELTDLLANGKMVFYNVETTVVEPKWKEQVGCPNSDKPLDVFYFTDPVLDLQNNVQNFYSWVWGSDCKACLQSACSVCIANNRTKRNGGLTKDQFLAEIEAVSPKAIDDNTSIDKKNDLDINSEPMMQEDTETYVEKIQEEISDHELPQSNIDILDSSQVKQADVESEEEQIEIVNQDKEIEEDEGEKEDLIINGGFDNQLVEEVKENEDNTIETQELLIKEEELPIPGIGEGWEKVFTKLFLNQASKMSGIYFSQWYFPKEMDRSNCPTGVGTWNLYWTLFGAKDFQLSPVCLRCEQEQCNICPFTFSFRKEFSAVTNLNTKNLYDIDSDLLLAVFRLMRIRINSWKKYKAIGFSVNRYNDFVKTFKKALAKNFPAEIESKSENINSEQNPNFNSVEDAEQINFVLKDSASLEEQDLEKNLGIVATQFQAQGISEESVEL